MADQAGDAFSERSKYTHDFEKEKTYDMREHKFSYPSLMEAQIRKLKHGLENWKEICLHGKKMFIWEKQWHPSAIMGASTIVFMFLWLLEPSILTVFSVFGLCVTIGDYLIPTIAGSFFKPEKWTARREQEFEELCTNIILYKARMELAWARFYKMKSTNRKMYFGLSVMSLSMLAWIGCTFNNLFLAYLLVNILLLLPGLEHNGVLKKWNSCVHNFFLEVMKQGKSKVPEKKD